MTEEHPLAELARRARLSPDLASKIGIEPMNSPDPTTSLLVERGGTHGSFIENARISQAIKRVFRSSPNWEAFSDVQKEAFELDALKMSRALSGNMSDPKWWDNIDDLLGYTKLFKEPR